jgi:hypothetical protein
MVPVPVRVILTTSSVKQLLFANLITDSGSSGILTIARSYYSYHLSLLVALGPSWSPGPTRIVYGLIQVRSIVVYFERLSLVMSVKIYFFNPNCDFWPGGKLQTRAF